MQMKSFDFNQHITLIINQLHN